MRHMFTKVRNFFAWIGASIMASIVIFFASIAAVIILAFQLAVR